MLTKVLNITYTYLIKSFNGDRLKDLCGLLCSLADLKDFNFEPTLSIETYDELQDILSNINEKEYIRREKGVYYTPRDVVKFMLLNVIKAATQNLTPYNLKDLSLDSIEKIKIAQELTLFDPTCGTGEFLIAALDLKFDLLCKLSKDITPFLINKLVSTVYGNDVNAESIKIAKIRLFLCTLHRFGVECASSVVTTLNHNFSNYDFVQSPNSELLYDIVIGNPPYVEDSKCGLNHLKKYGNIYANVLKNSAELLKEGGAFAFIIPISYISTPRMSAIREDLFKIVSEQYILSYSDRPDCLFSSVHQKLCILLALKKNAPKKVYTSNYTYWYKSERKSLFCNTHVVENDFIYKGFIPKLGTDIDKSIFKKITFLNNTLSLSDLSQDGTGTLYLNMRATFWIKSFTGMHSGSEYKLFRYENQNTANYALCLLNSSLFWWFWISISDCWHITKKELSMFKVPNITEYSIVNMLAKNLESKLESTKLYVGTKQTEYEYKHKNCQKEISEIDEYISKLFKLTKEEHLYLRNFAYKYRMGGGVLNE